MSDYLRFRVSDFGFIGAVARTMGFKSEIAKPKSEIK